MDKPLVIQRFVPAKVSTTSDSQVGIGSGTAEMSNLSAIMRNNIVVFESPLALVPGTDGTHTEEDTE
ncbi:MAG: hypothetical protein ACP5I1_03800 [Candidatus Hinthialibacter sp.]